MKTIEKKNKIIGPAGSRTSTRQRLARGLRPLQGRFSANARARLRRQELLASRARAAPDALNARAR